MKPFLVRALPVLFTVLPLLSCDKTTPSEIIWERTFFPSSNWYNRPGALLPAADGYLLVTTRADSLTNYSPRLLIERLSPGGDSVWAKAYVPADTSAALSSGVTAFPASSGGWLVVGASVSTASYQLNSAYVVRTDSLGDTLWTRTLQDTTYTSGPAACAAADGGCFVAMWRYWDSLAAVHVSLVDSTGNRAWTRTYWSDSGVADVSICPAPDGGFFLAGAGGMMYPSPVSRLRLLRADRNGDTLWTYQSDTLHDSWQGIAPTADGGCIATGTHLIRRFTSNQAEACLLKLSAAGQLDWEKRGGFEWSRQPVTIQQLDDGGYLYAGRSSVDNSTAFLCRTDGQGNEMWFSNFGDPSAEADCVVPTSDGDYVVAGQRSNPATYQSWIFLARVSPSGN